MPRLYFPIDTLWEHLEAIAAHPVKFNLIGEADTDRLGGCGRAVSAGLAGEDPRKLRSTQEIKQMRAIPPTNDTATGCDYDGLELYRTSLTDPV